MNNQCEIKIILVFRRRSILDIHEDTDMGFVQAVRLHDAQIVNINIGIVARKLEVRSDALFYSEILKDHQRRLIKVIYHNVAEFYRPALQINLLTVQQTMAARVTAK